MLEGLALRIRFPDFGKLKAKFSPIIKHHNDQHHLQAKDFLAPRQNSYTFVLSLKNLLQNLDLSSQAEAAA